MKIDGKDINIRVHPDTEARWVEDGTIPAIRQIETPTDIEFPCRDEQRLVCEPGSLANIARITLQALDTPPAS
jgi:hypothetical protein